MLVVASQDIRCAGGNGREMQNPWAMSHPNVAQPLEHFVVLDALGDDDETEVVAEVDGRAHDHLVLLVERAGWRRSSGRS